MKTPRLLGSLCISAVAVILLGAGHSAKPQTSSGKSTQGATKSAPTGDLPLIDLAGYNQVLGKYKGKPVLVTFWATWCEPCRDEYPMIVELEKKYAPQGLAVFGVSLDDTADLNVARRFLAKHQPGFPNYRQKPGIDVDAFYRGVNPAWTGTMPETIFYGRDGRIAGHFVGEQSRDMFEKAVRMILGNSSQPVTGK